MNLKESIKAINSGDLKIFDDLDSQIEKIQLEKYLLAVHNFVETVKKANKNNKDDLCMTINLYSYGPKLPYFSSNIYKSNKDELLVGKKNNGVKKPEVKVVIKEISEALLKLTPTDRKWIGTLNDDNLTLNLNDKDLEGLEKYFLNEELLPIYNSAKLDTELSENLPVQSKKPKL